MDLTKIPEDNNEFAAQLIFQKFSRQKRAAIRKILDELDNCLYKSYLKDLSLTELREVMRICDPEKEKKEAYKDYFPEVYGKRNK
jgi:hypothetical protein